MISLKDAIAAAATAEPSISADGVATLALAFPPTFPGFSGHFPGFPILPAVVQVMAGMLVTQHLRGEPLRLLALEGAKFVKPVGPDAPLQVDCSPLDPSRGTYSIRLTNSGEVVSTFRLIVEAA